jgi:hypothetical protein
MAQDIYNLSWHPGQENLADHQSKHHVGSHHVAVRPCYLHMKISHQVLPRVARPSALKGCVGTLKVGYICKVPLPRPPRIQHASHTSHGEFSILSQNWAPNCHERMELLAPRIQCASHASPVTHDTCYSEQVPCIPMWSDLTRSLADLGRRALLLFSLALMLSSLTYPNNLC